MKWIIQLNISDSPFIPPKESGMNHFYLKSAEKSKNGKWFKRKWVTDRGKAIVFHDDTSAKKAIKTFIPDKEKLAEISMY